MNDISFDLKPGKITALLGHNGAGKTTMIKSILQLISYEGEIFYPFDKNDIYKNVNVQMQSSSYESNVKVIEMCNLYKKVLNADADIKKLLSFFELDKHKNSYVNTLSGGEKQKLTILLTLINRPPFLMYDELTTGLDAIARRSIWEMLKKVQNSYDTTILITSHMLEEIEFLADEVIILENGIIKFIGDVREFIYNVYGGKKLITFKNNGEINLSKIAGMDGVEITLNRDIYHVVFSNVLESEIVRELYNSGIKNLENHEYSFEDAFLKVFNYKLTSEGDTKYENII